jgi:hypothetical protein
VQSEEKTLDVKDGEAERADGHASLASLGALRACGSRAVNRLAGRPGPRGCGCNWMCAQPPVLPMPPRMIDVDEPRPLADDEVLLEVMAAGVGNWDEFVRTGGSNVAPSRRWNSACRQPG